MEEIKAQFKSADENGDGMISFEELEAVFLALGDWESDELKEMFAEVDKSNDGRVSYNEFCDWVLGSGGEECEAAADGAADLIGETGIDVEAAIVEKEEAEVAAEAAKTEDEPAAAEAVEAVSVQNNVGFDTAYFAPAEAAPEAVVAAAAAADAEAAAADADAAVAAALGGEEGGDAEADEEDEEYEDEELDALDDDLMQGGDGQEEYADEEDADVGDPVKLEKEAKILKQEFLIICRSFEIPLGDAAAMFKNMADYAAEQGTGGADEGVPLDEALCALEVDENNVGLMKTFKEALDYARSGDAPPPVEENAEKENAEKTEEQKAAALESAIEQLTAYLFSNDMKPRDVYTLLTPEKNPLKFSIETLDALLNVENLEAKVKTIKKIPPALNATAGGHANKDRCMKEVDDIIAKCKAEGKMFTDDSWDVTANPNSVLYTDKEKPGYDCTVGVPDHWMRASQICKEPVLVSGGAKACDIIQGNIGTCFLLGALGAIVCNDPKSIEKMFIKYDIAVGIYGIRVSVQGEWHYVVIDDYVPVDAQDNTMFAWGKDKNEIWVALLEKAYAKLLTCFENVDGGQGSEAISNLCGGVNGWYPITEDHKANPASYFKLLSKARKQGDLLTCGFSAAGHAGAGGGKCGEAVLPTGLVGGHAYSVLRLVEAGGNQLICCRNPWGQGEWTGKWSDKNTDGEWTDEMKEACGWTDTVDGIFWMSIEDYVAMSSGFTGYARTFGANYKKVTKYTKFAKCPKLKGTCVKAYPEEPGDIPEDELALAVGDEVDVADASGWWFSAALANDPEKKGMFPGGSVKLKARPLARFDFKLEAADAEKPSEAYVLLLQPNAYRKRKFYKRPSDGLNYKDTSYAPTSLIIVQPDGKIMKKTAQDRCNWQRVRIPAGSSGELKIYAMSLDGKLAGEKLCVKVYVKNGTPSLQQVPGAKFAELRELLSKA